MSYIFRLPAMTARSFSHIFYKAILNIFNAKPQNRLDPKLSKKLRVRGFFYICMCIYIYIMYVYIYIYMCVYIYIYMHACIYKHICIRFFISVFTIIVFYICLFIYTHVKPRQKRGTDFPPAERDQSPHGGSGVSSWGSRLRDHCYL